MEWKALSPAKVNLFLKVLRRREDGYHDLLSLVDIISLSDVIHFEELDDDVILLSDDRGVLPAGEGNTMFRAAALLKRAFRIRKGIRIHVEKRIPIGSGLGGPSSNGATVLKELALRWDLPATEPELMALGAKVGADVPLFVGGRSCVMTGIGERVEPVTLPQLTYIIVYPKVVMSTREVYGNLRIVLTKEENDVTLSRHFSSARDVARILENDLEEVGILMCPAITSIKERLREAGSIGTLMSGSGSSVFGIFESDVHARIARPALSLLGEVFIAESIHGGMGYGDNGCQSVSR